MAQHFTRVLADIFPYAHISNSFKALILENLSKTQAATKHSILEAKGRAASMFEAIPGDQTEAGELIATAFDQAIENTDAAFVAAQAIADSKSPLEAAQIQTKYFQTQFVRAGEQTRQLLGLWSKAAQTSLGKIGLESKAFESPLGISIPVRNPKLNSAAEAQLAEE